MATNETMGDKRPVNAPGLYRHEESGKEIITSGGFHGQVQADAAVQVGFKRVGDAPKPKAAKTETPTK